jgi:catalase
MRAHEPEAFLDASTAKVQSGGYLREEMVARLQRRTVLFDFIAYVADPGDRTSDPTSYWPVDREQVVLGTVTVRSVVGDSDALQRTTLFDPARLTPGIELSDDPMVAVRSQSYAISFGRRRT